MIVRNLLFDIKYLTLLEIVVNFGLLEETFSSIHIRIITSLGGDVKPLLTDQRLITLTADSP